MVETKEELIIDSKTLRRIQLLELDILKEIDRICRKYGLHYTLCGGSMLGAIRHKGIIPWDDDIDVTMLRSDYDKFFELCKMELDTNKYFAQTTDTDPEYRLIYGRILLKGTSFVRAGQEHMKAKNGFFVDIFPRDGVSDNLFIRTIQGILAKLMRKMLYSPVGALRARSGYARVGFRILRHFPKASALSLLKMVRFLNFGRETTGVACWGLMGRREHRKLELGKKAYKEYKKMVRSLPYGDKLAMKERDKGIIRREWFYQTEDLPFEDMAAMVTTAWDTWLTYNYDDYMELPPVDKQKMHQTVSYIDFGGYT